MGAILNLPAPSTRQNTVTDIYRIKISHPKEVVQVNISSTVSSGTWSLNVDGAVTNTLQLGCPPQALCVSVNQTTQLDVLCSLVLYDSSGTVVTDMTLAVLYSYNITFWSQRPTSNVPIFQDVSLDPSATFNVAIIANRIGNASGFFTLEMQGSKMTLNSNTSINNFYDQLISDTPCTPAVEMRSYYNAIDGSEWWLYFEESGVQPLISIYSTNFNWIETTMTISRETIANTSQEMMIPLTFDYLWTYSNQLDYVVHLLNTSNVRPTATSAGEYSWDECGLQLYLQLSISS